MHPNRPFPLTRSAVAMATVVLLALLATDALAQAARVVLAVGDVTLVRGTERTRLTAGTTVNTGDTVQTGAQGNAQLRFSDNALVALKPDSEFRIEAYAFNGTSDGSERAVFRLVRGGFRTVTGQVGQVNRDTYQVLTTQATIGIRGTHYQLLVCGVGQCRDSESSTPAPAGLYGGVFEGRVAVTGRGITDEYGQREFFFVPDDQPPQRLIGPPLFLADQQSGRPVTSGPTGDRATMADLNFAKVPEYAIDPSLPIPPYVFQATEDLDNGRLIELNNITAAVGSDRYTIEVGSTSGGAAIGRNTDGQMTSFVNNNLNANVGTAAIVDTGSALAAGSINWGRWQGPGSTITQQLGNGETVTNNGGNLHYIYGATPTNLPTSGQVTYTPVGGTRPTDSLSGAVGTLVSGGKINVDFGTANLTLSGLTVGFNNATYTMGGSTSIQNGLFSTTGPGATFACTGSGCQPLIAGNFVGFFAGNRGAGVGLDYFFNYRGGGVIEGVSGYRRCAAGASC
jgi:FecR protein